MNIKIKTRFGIITMSDEAFEALYTRCGVTSRPNPSDSHEMNVVGVADELTNMIQRAIKVGAYYAGPLSSEADKSLAKVVDRVVVNHLNASPF